MNEFYTYGDTLIGGTTANAEDVAAEFNAIVSGLDKLPTEAQLKSGQLNYAVDTGAANAYVVTMPQPPLSLYDGYTIQFKAANANTTSSTINVNGLGAKSLVNTDGSVLQSGDVVAGAMITAVYDGTKFQITSVMQGAVNTAVNAKNAAVTAQGLAEDAQGLAEDARDAAIVAQGLAEDAADTLNIPPVAGESGKWLYTDGVNKSWETLTTYADLLSEATLSSDTVVDFVFPGGYSQYIIEMLNVSVTTGDSISLRTSSNGGLLFDSAIGAYKYSVNSIADYDSTSSINNSGIDNTTRIPTNVPSKNICGSVVIYNTEASLPTKLIFTMTGRSNDGFGKLVRGFGERTQSNSVDALRMYPDTGSLISGTVKLYGVK